MPKFPSGAVITADHADVFAAVAGVLWSERETLDRLLFKLVEEQLVLAAGSTRWLNQADQEVRNAMERLRLGEVIRAAEVSALAESLNLPLETTLAELATIAPEPWPFVLTEHRTALRTLVAEIEAVAAENRRLLHAGAHAIRETLDRLGDAVAGYDANGGAVSYGASGGPFLLDEQV
ncbi:MAG: flagellar protein FlgN [Jatrophihabitantaceae bacterium]